MDKQTSGKASDVLDYEQLLARCLGNIEFAERVLERFQTSFGEDLAELERSLEMNDADRVASVAHRLKGASANVSAPMLSRWAAEIEELSREASLSVVAPHVERLRDEWSRFVDARSCGTLWSDATSTGGAPPSS